MSDKCCKKDRAISKPVSISRYEFIRYFIKKLKLQVCLDKHSLSEFDDNFRDLIKLLNWYFDRHSFAFKPDKKCPEEYALSVDPETIYYKDYKRCTLTASVTYIQSLFFIDLLTDYCDLSTLSDAVYVTLEDEFEQILKKVNMRCILVGASDDPEKLKLMYKNRMIKKHVSKYGTTNDEMLHLPNPDNCYRLGIPR